MPETIDSIVAGIGLTLSLGWVVVTMLTFKEGEG